MSIKIGVVIPVRNCLEYTQAALASLHTRYSLQVFVIDDHSDSDTKDWLANQPEMTVYTDPPGSTGLAWNWNLGISAALNDCCTHVLVINNDILLHRDTVDALVDRINLGDTILVTGDDIAPRANAPEDIFSWNPNLGAESHHLDYSCFMIVPETLRRIGWFDEEFFGAYYEDNDYTARIIRANECGVRSGAAPYYHYSMRTVNGNPETKSAIQRCAAKNGERFQNKWGRLPAGSLDEMLKTYFRYPFNLMVSSETSARRRFEEMYLHSQGGESSRSVYSDPLFRLASTVNTVRVVGDMGIKLSCVVACADPERLFMVGGTEVTAQTRFTAAARISGLDLQLEPTDASEFDIQPADLLIVSSKTLSSDLSKLEPYLSATERFLIIFHDPRVQGGESSGKLRCFLEYFHSYPQWRLQSSANYSVTLLKK